MSNEEVVFNGIHARTGHYFTPPMEAQALARLALSAQDAVPEEQKADLQRTAERSVDFRVDFSVDPTRLDQTGWGVIFAARDPQAQALYDALAVLLEHRREQAGDLYREYFGGGGSAQRQLGYLEGESKIDFLRERGANTEGVVFPQQMPYYLLIVGSPELIPFAFQYQLDVQYAVGRIHFDALEEYSYYAQSVVAAENGTLALPRRAVFFSVTHDGDDRATELSNSELVQPLHAALGEKVDDWALELIKEDAAHKDALHALVNGAEAPGLLFTASHGLGFDADDPLQERHQGALLCSNWETFTPTQPKSYFSADDVSEDARLHGLIAFNFACFGAGTPVKDEFDHVPGLQNKPQLARRPFVSRLPQKLLAHPKGGALAVVGHVNRAWSTSFTYRSAPQLNVFDEAFRKLFFQFPVGNAIESFNERYASSAASLTNALAPVRDLIKAGSDVPAHLIQNAGGLWTAQNDARNYIILGDPAVRLMLQQKEEAPQREVLTLVKLSVDERGGATEQQRPTGAAEGEVGTPKPEGQSAGGPGGAVPLQEAHPGAAEVAGRDMEGAQRATVESAGEMAPATTAGGAEPADFGLFSREEGRGELDELRRTLADFMRKLGEAVASFTADVSSLEVKTYTTGDLEDLDELAFDIRTKRFSGPEKPRLRALTFISLDGDQISVIPEDDEELWRLHNEIVAQAQANRAALLRAMMSAVSGLTRIE